MGIPVTGSVISSSGAEFQREGEYLAMQAHEVEAKPLKPEHHFFRFHVRHSHLSSVFGNDWFALKAEAFARFFGTPVFLIAQTLVVAVWIIINSVGPVTFDVYPF